VSPARLVQMDENVKRYKTLLSSAPAHSILNAQAFNYTNSVETDIRKTFARVRRELANAAVIANIGSHVRCVTTKMRDISVPRRPVRSIA
jgi:hypothetical protein